MSAIYKRIIENKIGEKSNLEWRVMMPMLLGVAIFFNTIQWSWQNNSLFTLIAWVLLLARHLFFYSHTFQARKFPLILLTITCLLHLANRQSLDIHVISICLLILYYFALSACYLSADDWRKLQLPTLLILLLTPLFEYLQLYAGFPLRLLSARIAGDLLESFHLPILSVSDMLYLENRYMQVDFNCSGFNGLWAGLIFFVLLSWIYRRRVNLQWWLSVLVFTASLLAFNAIRISSIVWIDLIQKHHQLAASLHQSIGIVCFIIACMLGWSLIVLPQFQWQKTLAMYFNRFSPSTLSNAVHKYHSAWLQQFQASTVFKAVNTTTKIKVNTLSSTLILISILCALPQSAANPSGTSPKAPTLQLPDNWSPAISLLNQQESLFFSDKKASINKQSFTLGESQASLIIVTSHYWKTQHNPKHCLQAQGYTLNEEKTVRIGNTTRIRKLDLVREQQGFTSVFWWQNANRQTEDYGQRVFTGIIHPNEPWTMVSILVKGSLTDRQIADLVAVIRPQLDGFYRL